MADLNHQKLTVNLGRFWSSNNRRFQKFTVVWHMPRVAFRWCKLIHPPVRNGIKISTDLRYLMVVRSRRVVQSVTMWWSKELLCATKNHKVVRQYYSVRPCTTKYYPGSVVLCTTKYYNVLLQYYSVLQSTTPVLLCTTKYYSSTTLYYKVLLQYYSSITKYYANTTLYYKVLRQYYSVLQSAAPVLLCTTKYCASTTLYYKVLYSSTTKYYSSTTPVLPQYYSVLQSITPVTTPYYSLLQSTIPVLLRTTTCYSSTTTYFSSTTLYYKVLQSTTPVLLCTTKNYSNTTPVLQSISSILPNTSVLQSPTPVLLWNIIYNVRSNSYHSPTSPNTAPATQNESHH